MVCVGEFWVVWGSECAAIGFELCVGVSECE